VLGFRRRRNTATPREMKKFAKDLFRSGVYVLGCGGGVISQPRRALGALKPEYELDELLRLSMEMLFEQPTDWRCPEGTIGTARGIICHIGDADLVQRLLCMREEWLPTPGEAPADNDPEQALRASKVEHVEVLVAGLSSRLGLPLPEGIAPMHPLDEYNLFEDG